MADPEKDTAEVTKTAALRKDRDFWRDVSQNLIKYVLLPGGLLGAGAFGGEVLRGGTAAPDQTEPMRQLQRDMTDLKTSFGDHARNTDDRLKQLETGQVRMETNIVNLTKAVDKLTK